MSTFLEPIETDDFTTPPPSPRRGIIQTRNQENVTQKLDEQRKLMRQNRKPIGPNSFFALLLEEIEKEAAILEKKWKKIGISLLNNPMFVKVKNRAGEEKEEILDLLVGMNNYSENQFIYKETVKEIFNSRRERDGWPNWLKSMRSVGQLKNEIFNRWKEVDEAFKSENVELGVAIQEYKNLDAILREIFTRELPLTHWNEDYER